MFGIAELEAAILVDGRLQRAGGRIRLGAAVDGEGFDVKGFGHCKLLSRKGSPAVLASFLGHVQQVKKADKRFHRRNETVMKKTHLAIFFALPKKTLNCYKILLYY